MTVYLIQPLVEIGYSFFIMYINIKEKKNSRSVCEKPILLNYMDKSFLVRPIDNLAVTSFSITQYFSFRKIREITYET